MGRTIKDAKRFTIKTTVTGNLADRILRHMHTHNITAKTLTTEALSAYIPAEEAADHENPNPARREDSSV